MGKYLDLEAESFDVEGGSEDDDTGDGAAEVEEAPESAGGKDENTRSPSPKHRRRGRGEPTCGRKKTVQCTLPIMITPKKETVQFTADLLASTFQTAPAQEDITASSLDVTGVADALALNPPDHIEELPPTSKMGSLIDIAVVPLSSPTTELVSISKI